MSAAYPDRIFLDNIVPLKGGIDGPQLAAWTPGPAVKSGLGCVLYADQMIPVDKDVSLAADVYTPKAAGRYPAIVVFSAYSKELQSSGAPTGTNEIGSPPIFTGRGYVHVVVARRGIGRSQGESVVFCNDTDGEDHAKVIAWTAVQPWCDGNVVLFGTSYYGMSQALVAVKQPPALKGFFSIEMCTDYFRHIVMFGGAPQVDFLTLWMGANFTNLQKNLHVPPLVRALLSHAFNSPLKRWWWPQVRKRLTRIMKGFQRKAPTKEMREFWASIVFDGKTRATSTMADGPSSSLSKINVPFVVVQNPGHFNLHQFGGYELFRKAGTPEDRKWLIVSAPDYELPCYHWQLEALAFFDHILFGSANGYARQAPVRYWRDGAEDYRSATNFPIPESKAIRFHLASSGADSSTHRLTLADGNAGSNRWAAVPMGALVTAGLDEVANQILSYETAVDDDLELTGPIDLSLSFSSNEIDSHVIARLSRIDASGGLHPLSLGSIRPACRRIDEARSTTTEIAIDIDAPQPLTRNEPVTLLFSLTPQPVLFRKGERLRLDVGSRTDLLISDQTHGRAQFEMQVPPYYSRNKLHYGSETYVQLRSVRRTCPPMCTENLNPDVVMMKSAGG
jgi:putative CocE/NonD family hydrolase